MGWLELAAGCRRWGRLSEVEADYIECRLVYRLQHHPPPTAPVCGGGPPVPPVGGGGVSVRPIITGAGSAPGETSIESFGAG